jgi:hypothetical protein
MQTILTNLCSISLQTKHARRLSGILERPSDRWQAQCVRRSQFVAFRTLSSEGVIQPEWEEINNSSSDAECLRTLFRKDLFYSDAWISGRGDSGGLRNLCAGWGCQWCRASAPLRWSLQFVLASAKKVVSAVQAVVSMELAYSMSSAFHSAGKELELGLIG